MEADAKEFVAKKIMVVMGICWEGRSKIYIVDRKAKVNAEYLIQHILTPMFDKDIPRLYGVNARKVVLHMDSAPSHVAKETTRWLQDRGIKFIPKEKWLANSPDMSPLDYAINADFKKRFWGRWQQVWTV